MFLPPPLPLHRTKPEFGIKLTATRARCNNYHEPEGSEGKNSSYSSFLDSRGENKEEAGRHFYYAIYLGDTTHTPCRWPQVFCSPLFLLLPNLLSPAYLPACLPGGVVAAAPDTTPATYVHLTCRHNLVYTR